MQLATIICCHVPKTTVYRDHVLTLQSNPPIIDTFKMLTISKVIPVNVSFIYTV